MGVSRRDWLALFASSASLGPAHAAGADARWAARSVPTTEPTRQLRPGGPSGLLGVGPSGALWALSLTGAAPRRLALGIDPASPLATGHGRIAARGRRWPLDLGR